LRGWKRALARLDYRQPIAGIDQKRWANLVDNADWLLAEHGENAARFGWDTADLFGLWPDKPAWGGVVDRLRGARSLLLSADVATWRTRHGEAERYARGAYPDLRPFWDG
jgi:hypothetical protein